MRGTLITSSLIQIALIGLFVCTMLQRAAVRSQCDHRPNSGDRDYADGRRLGSDAKDGVGAAIIIPRRGAPMRPLEG